MKKIMIMLVLALLVIGGLYRVHQKRLAIRAAGDQPARTTVVRTAVAQRGDHRVTRNYLAQVEPWQRTTVAAQMVSRVTDVRVQAGRAGVLASERQFLPRVELFAAGGVYGADDPETGTGEVDNDLWKITVPLLDNGLRAGRLAVSRAELDKARADLRARRLAVIEEIAVARSGVKSARVKIAATQKTVVHARKVVEIEQLKYSIGRGTSAEVLEAQAALLTAEGLAKKAVRELALARLAQQLALGQKQG